jgi:hypothetical protein
VLAAQKAIALGVDAIRARSEVACSEPARSVGFNRPVVSERAADPRDNDARIRDRRVPGGTDDGALK